MPAVGTAGGTISVVNFASFQVVSFSHLTFSSTLILQSTACAHHIAITNIYAPPSRSLKLAFLDELASIAQPDDTPWLIAGDFNLIRFPSEKNNTAFRPAEANAFNQTLDNLALIELPLLDRRFTWSNNRASPTLEWLDRVFLTLHGQMLSLTLPFPLDPALRRDHVPLLIHVTTTIPRSNFFKFVPG